MTWKSVATFVGLGAFIGFIIAVLSYAPVENDLFAYGIYAGALIGAFMGLKWRVDFRSAPAAFLLGLGVTFAVGLVWGVSGINVRLAQFLLALVMAAMVLIKPVNFTDVLLSPATYLGGFAIALLTLKFYSPLQGVEHGVTAVIIMTGSAITFVFFGSLARWGFEKFRELAGRNNV